MTIYPHTEPADGHPNEDAIAFFRPASDSTILVCALADGQGGRSGGAAAAQTAVSVCVESAKEYSNSELLNPFTWVSICEAADKQVCHHNDSSFTTLIGLATCPSFVAGASCGDSAVALLLDNQFIVLTDNQYKNPPVGSGAARLTPFSARLSSPWKLLIMSDGVWKYVGWERIASLAQNNDANRLGMSLREVAVETTAGQLADDFSLMIIQS